MRWLLITVGICALSGCADSGKDYDASAKCQGQGFKPGTAEYDKCIDDEKLSKAMQQQREEFEQMKQYQQDQRMMHY